MHIEQQSHDITADKIDLAHFLYVLQYELRGTSFRLQTLELFLLTWWYFLFLCKGFCFFLFFFLHQSLGSFVNLNFEMQAARSPRPLCGKRQRLTQKLRRAALVSGSSFFQFLFFSFSLFFLSTYVLFVYKYCQCTARQCNVYRDLILYTYILALVR